MRRLLARARLELTPLILLLLTAGGISLFAELAREVSENETLAFDRALLLALREPGRLADPWGPSWVEGMGRDFTALGSVAVLALLTLAVCAYLVLDRKRKAALLVLIAVSGGLIGSFSLKEVFRRPRPDLVSHVGTTVTTASFPSAHSMMAASTYLTLGALLARVQKRRRQRVFLISLACLLTFLVGLSRVYLGVHWPTDVLAGWAAGAAWAFLCWMVALSLQRRGAVEKPGKSNAASAAA